MGLLTEMARDVRGVMESRISNWSGVSPYMASRPVMQNANYQTLASEGYATNALVYACINELATSVSEPAMQAKWAGQWRKLDDGGNNPAIQLLSLLARPNDWMDHAMFWSAVVMYRSISGNAYALKERDNLGRVIGLWLLRPDRISIVPDARRFISRYEYNIGDVQPVALAPEDVIHWKTPNPLDEFYGHPPLKGIAKAVDLDNYSFEFVGEYFTNAGVPSGIMAIKGRLDDALKQEIRSRLSRDHGQGKRFGTLVIDGAEATYTAMTAALGSQGLVLPELNKIVEARITGALGVPPTLVGTVIGTEASSYGNKKSERESFWNETMKPLYRELVGPLNRSLVTDFRGVQEVAFDLSTVGALLPDADALHARVRSDATAGLISLEEAREVLGYKPELPSGHTFLIPSNLTQTPAEDVGVPPEPAPSLNGNGTKPAVGVGV